MRAFAIGAALGIATLATPAAAERIVRVTDGDTFRLEGGERIRIAGIDAAESQRGNAKCARELAIGTDAKRRAIALLKDRDVTVERVGRSYGRTVARIGLDGRDLAGLLVERGIARWWPRGAPKPDWCASRR